MKYIKFRFDAEVIGAGDLLVHAIRAYDLAGTIAAENRDYPKLLEVGDKIRECSDRLIALTMTEEMEGNIEDVRSNGEFGFTIPKPPSPSDGDCGEEG